MAGDTDTAGQSDTRLLIMNDSIPTTDSANSSEFFLRFSEFFSVEWENSAAVNHSLKLQMKCSDEATWIDATTGSALNTSVGTLHGFVDMFPPFSTGKFRIVATNHNASTRTMKLWLHRSPVRR